MHIKYIKRKSFVLKRIVWQKDLVLDNVPSHRNNKKIIYFFQWTMTWKIFKFISGKIHVIKHKDFLINKKLKLEKNSFVSILVLGALLKFNLHRFLMLIYTFSYVDI